MLVPESSNAVADSSGVQSHAPVLLTQLPNACPTSTSSTPKHATANASTLPNASVELPSPTPLAAVPPCQLASLHKSLTTRPVDADVQPLRHADVDSTGTSTHAHVSPTPTPDACPTCTPSTYNHAIASARLKLNACVELRQSTPPALALLIRTVQHNKHSTPPHANADVPKQHHADVD